MEFKIKVDDKLAERIMEDHELTTAAFQKKLQERINDMFETILGIGTDFELWLDEMETFDSEEEMV